MDFPKPHTCTRVSARGRDIGILDVPQQYLVLMIEDNRILIHQFLRIPEFDFPQMIVGPMTEAKANYYRDKINTFYQNKEISDEVIDLEFIANNVFGLACVAVCDDLYELVLYYLEEIYILNLTYDACKNIYTKLRESVQDKETNLKFWRAIKEVFEMNSPTKQSNLDI